MKPKKFPKISGVFKNKKFLIGSLLLLLLIPISSAQIETSWGSNNTIDHEFNSTDYEFDAVKFIVYGYPKKVIVDLTGGKIGTAGHAGSQCQADTAVELSVEPNQTYSEDISFLVFENCDDYYAAGEYQLTLRTCEPDGSKFGTDYRFNISIAGKNESVCNPPEDPPENNNTQEQNNTTNNTIQNDTDDEDDKPEKNRTEEKRIEEELAQYQQQAKEENNTIENKSNNSVTQKQEEVKEFFDSPTEQTPEPISGATTNEVIWSSGTSSTLVVAMMFFIFVLLILIILLLKKA